MRSKASAAWRSGLEPAPACLPGTERNFLELASLEAAAEGVVLAAPKPALPVVRGGADAFGLEDFGLLPTRLAAFKLVVVVVAENEVLVLVVEKWCGIENASALVWQHQRLFSSTRSTIDSIPKLGLVARTSGDEDSCGGGGSSSSPLFSGTKDSSHGT